MISTKKWIIISCVLLLLAVILEAFGTHGLQPLLSKKMINSYKIGTKYQFYAGFAILVLLSLKKFFKPRFLKYALYSFLYGSFLFCGSIYGFTLLRIFIPTGDFSDFGIYKIFVFSTPLGGILFVLAWIFILLATLKKRDSKISDS